MSHADQCDHAPEPRERPGPSRKFYARGTMLGVHFELGYRVADLSEMLAKAGARPPGGRRDLAAPDALRPTSAAVAEAMGRWENEGGSIR